MKYINWKDFLFIVLTLGLILVGLGLLMYLGGEGGQCLQNPLDYYENYFNVTCRCSENTGFEGFMNYP